MRGRRHLVLRYGVDEFRFSTTYWYDDVDFVELEARYGDDAMRKVYFHLLAFEANKAGSLAPSEIDAGPYDDLVTDSFWDLWETLFHNVWGVWRLENDLPDYRLPRPSRPWRRRVRRADQRRRRDDQAAVVVRWRQGQPRGDAPARAGRDRLRRVHLLPLHVREGRGSTCARRRPVAHCRPRRMHRAWILDDAVDAPIAADLPAARDPSHPRRRDGQLVLDRPTSRAPARVRRGRPRDHPEHRRAQPRVGPHRRGDQLPVGDERSRRAAAPLLRPGRVGGEPDDVPPAATDLRRQRVRPAPSTTSTPSPPPTPAPSTSRGAVAAPSVSTCG